MFDATTANTTTDCIRNHMGLIDSIIGAESGGNSDASNPNSSAVGLGQFIAPTWLSTIKATRPDLAQGKSDDELLALRSDPQLSRDMTEAYAQQNQAILAKAGVPVTDGNTYLAHFAGPQGAVKELQADPSASVADILGPGVVKANPFLANMSAADLQAWASRKMGSAPQAPQAAPSAPQPAMVAPQPQSAPTFAQAPQAAPQQASAPAYVPDTPQQPLNPIFASPRRPVDLTKLRAAFQPPQFYRG
jgi:hypothetical protein